MDGKRGGKRREGKREEKREGKRGITRRKKMLEEIRK